MGKDSVNGDIKKSLKRSKEEMAVIFGERQMTYEATKKEVPIAKGKSLAVGRKEVPAKDKPPQPSHLFSFFQRKDDSSLTEDEELLRRSRPKLPVPTKELAENLECILVERFKGQGTNCKHGKCSMPNVYLLNSVNACAIADLLTKQMFDLQIMTDG
uniref:Protein TSSC4 n=1 Tax=Rhabditophanes sp. KR3021 TaxID=114890 RepID=A0AC35TMA9_9BILA